MIEMNKKRIINLLTIVVLLLSYSGIWAQSGGCTSMPNPVTYTRVGTDLKFDSNNKIARTVGQATVNGVVVTRTLENDRKLVGTDQGVKYSDGRLSPPNNSKPVGDVAPCGTGANTKAGYPIMDSNRVRKLTYKFSKPVVDIELFFAEFGYKQLPNKIDYADIVLKSNGNVVPTQLTIRNDCNNGATKTIKNGKERLASLSGKVTDVKAGITSTEPFDEMILENANDNTGYGFYVEICLNSIQPLNISQCAPDTMTNSFTASNQTKTINGVNVKFVTTGGFGGASGLNSFNYCGTNMNYNGLGTSVPFLGPPGAAGKKITYTFATPVTSAEIFLLAFGDSLGAVNTYDEVKFAVDGGGTMTLSQTYNCMPTGTTINSSSGLVRSADNKHITTDVAIKVTSSKPFTEIVLEDNTPTGTRSGNGYFVVLCESSIKLADTSTCTTDNIGTLFAANKTATYTTTSGVKVTRKMDPATGFASLSNTNYCTIAPTYPANLPLLVDSKVMTYEFDVPVTEAEVFLFAFGDELGAPNTYDELTFSTDNGTVSVTQTYSCNPSGITITNGKVRSVDNRKWTTDVGLKITSTKPFTKLILTDSTPTYGSATSGNGYLVAFCEKGLTKITQNELNNFITLDATISILADQSKCQQEAPTYKAKATANAFAATAKFDYILEVKPSGTSTWTAVETKSDVAPGTEYTFNANAFKTNNYHNAKVRVKYVYKNTLFPSVNGVAYSGEATYTLKDKPAITSLTASPTSLNETGATNITYTIKGTPGATVTYNINGGTPETLVLDPVTGVKTVDRSGQTAKTTLTITKVAKTGLCDLDNIAYKAEVDALGNSCTTHPSIQFAQASPATATMNGIQVTRTIIGVQDFFQSYTYTSGQMCQQTIMQGYPVMNANKTSIKYAFDKPITSVEVWLSGFGGETAPARADRVTFTLNCSGTEVFAASGCGSVTNAQFIATGNEVTHQANVYTQARVKVSSSVPFTELTLNDPGSTAGGYTVELCPGSIKPAVIKVTENPAELTACVGATGKYFTAKAKIDGVSGIENMSYKWQQSPNPNVPGSWVAAVAPSPNGSIKADGSTQARLTLNTIRESDNGLYYRAEFSFTKCNKTLDKVYSEPAKLNVPSASDIITIQATQPSNVTTSDCTQTTNVSAQAKIADGYTIKNVSARGGNIFGYYLEFKDGNTWKTYKGQQYSNNPSNHPQTLKIVHSQAPEGTTHFRVRYTVELTTGCEYTVYSSEFTFTKNLPAEPAINATQTVCQSEGKTLADLTTLSGIKWYDAATGGNEVVASTTLTASKRYWATVTTNGCESARKEVNVTVVAKPTTPTVQNKTECPATGNYDMANLVTVLPGHTLKWYNAATGNATTVSTVDRNKTAKTTYEKWVALVTSQGCESDRVKVTYTVDITTQPTITVPANNLSINCADSATAIDAAVNAWMATATATIGCGTATVTNNYATVKPTNLCSVNEFEVTFTVRDAFGNQKTDKKKITVDRLIANDDTESVARSTGKDIDVLSNDTVNGAQATTSNAKVTLVSDGGIGATVTSDGKIRIPGGSVAPGTYNVTYKLCDKNNTSRCGATATVAVTVNNSTIEANHDTPVALTYSASAAYAKAADNTDFNVLSNDKLSGVTPTLSQVDILPTNQMGVTIEASTGKIKVDGATAAGVYNLTYKIKEKNTTNTSATANVTVVVKNALVVNPATLTAPITPSTSATTPKEIGNVLNQTQLNGNKPNASQVSISVTQRATPPQSGDPVPSIDPATGKVLIPSGVKPGNYTIKYKVCDKAGGIAKSCSDEKTITVNVAGGNTTTTNNDDFTANPVERSNSEEVVKNGANPVNVLANDKLGTRTNIDTDVVTIRQTATTNSGVNIDTATGQIKVAANTPAGVHEVKYKITEKGQTTESSEATAKVVVKNKVELDPAAIPGTVNTPNDGNDKTIANILDKAKINGNKPDAADVVITVPNPAHKNNPSDIVPYVDTTTGKVIVPVGTKPGTHQITYQVCDKLPAGQSAAQTCKTATITIPVAANTATSANDDYASNPVEVSNSATSYVKNGTEDVNVLSNDALGGNTTINTNLVDITQTHTSHSGVNIETATGKVKVAPNTPAGEYTVKYTIAEKGGGPSSTESTVKVVVKNKVVVNQATIPSSVTPATDGTDKEIGDVLDQTEINGSKPSAAQVTITETSPAPKNDPSDKVPYIDTTTGKVKIPAGVKPGNYPITYQICDKATPASANTCKTATITVKVAGNHLDPKNDDFSQKKVERSTSDAYVKDGANDLNVLSNDKLGSREGLDTNVVTIEQTYTSNNGVTVEVATGKVKVAANTPAGTHTIKYTITEKGQTTPSAEKTVTVVVTNKITLTPADVVSNPVTPSTDKNTPKEIGDVLDGTKLNGTKPGIGTGANQVTISVVTPAQPQSSGDAVPELDTTTGKVKIPAGVKPGTYNITYKVCDNANPQTCETSTVPITVQGNTTTSADDDFTAHKVVHPTTNTSVSDNGTPVNVLSNDKLGDDDSITTNEVEIIQTATTNPKVSIDTATGEVKVEANTPAGEYTVKYKFKEKGQSDTEASQEKTVTVVVTNQVEIDRANNNYTGAPSINATPAEGGDVLDKVKINGNKPNANEVNITVDTPATGTTVPYLETSGADAGKIKIPQGTPAGTYTITYTVCDKAQPASARTCEQATATITVDANPIVANADNDNKVVTFSTAAQTVKKTDGTTLNVLANDKLGATTGLNNTLVTIETTQPVTDITIKGNGEVEVGANKAPGVYELKYKIKETADPTHVSAEATVKVVVKNKVELDAIPTTPANPSTDGRTPNAVVDILDNTKINGNKPNANEVTIEIVTPATPQSPGDIVPTIDTTTGKVVVPSGVKPGTYTITYKVCDKAQPDEAKTCKTNAVEITVTGNTIQATADDFTAHKVERSNNDASVKNGANEVNVLTNDELGNREGLDTNVVTIEQTYTSNNGVTVEVATGKVKVAANTPAGEHVVKYKITEKGQTTASNEVEVKVVVTNKVESEDATYTGTTPTDSNPTTAGNILDHVHFNGGSQAPDPSEVTVEIVTPAPGTTVPTIITTGADTGKIQIPQGTPAGTYPITYKVCDKATGAANTCKTHTATVTVNPATTDIVAQPDTYTLQWDAAERTAEGNILVNDRHLTRENLDTTLVDIQQVAASTPDKVSIDTATGKVKIAAGTPAGTHTISYTITPKGATSPVSAPALVTVVIKNKVELATNPINGAPSSDDTPREIGNVIDNVKINGQRPDPSDVTIEITPATPLEPGRPTPEVDPATGKVTVPKNTPSGEYTIGVKVCDKVTPKTCVNQNITIKVRPDQDLMAEEDEFSVGIMGGTTPSVLRNDKLRGRTGLTIADVTVQAIGRARAHTPGLPEPASDRIIIASDGRIDVKDGLQEGDYIYEYSIISKEDTNLISNARVIIHVAKNVAAEDEIEVEKPREGEADTTSTKSLLDNDAINGQKPIIGTTPGTVTIEKISVTPSAQDKIDIDTTTGKIIVKPGAPIGEHEVEYQICLNGRTSTCQTGKTKVKIQPQLTLAEDNFADRTIVTNNSTNQVGNVLANDTLDGQPIAASEVSIKVTNNAGIPGVTIDAEGNLTIPQGAPSGTHTIEYEIISNTYGVRKTGRVVVNLSNDADLEFYNAISTDEGSQNNGFIIKNIELYPKNNLKIFNRYGVLIFEKDGYTNASPFKGISEGRATVNKDGKLPQGTYYYILEYTDGKNQTQQKTGWLYIK